MSSSAYASLNGLAVLENPRQTTNKGLVFDSHLYIGAASRESIIGSFRYFNGNDVAFAEVGLYFIYATVCNN